MTWYIPSWNGDVRAERDPENGQRTLLTMHEVTAAERAVLALLAEWMFFRGWWGMLRLVTLQVPPPLWVPGKGSKQTVTLDAPLEKVGPILAEAFCPGDQTLTVMTLRNGEVEVVEGGVARKLEDRLAKPKTETAKEAKEQIAAAVTVKRPTPCCPQCVVQPISPADEVLKAFLTPEQWAEWQRSHTLMVRGGLTGHRYLLAHRHSATAAYFGKICCDLDDGVVLHFHDHAVPPPEEVLGAALVLRHREDWLRNEATYFPSARLPEIPSRVEFNRPNRQAFKNPFGSRLDGVADSAMTSQFGSIMAAIFPADFQQFLEDLNGRD